MVKETERTLPCPWCHKGEVIATGGGNAAVSIQCPKCKHFFRINLLTYQTEKSIAVRHVPRKTYRLEPRKKELYQVNTSRVTD